ncbi:unnamed protein product [Soboliphyme baturini]|uniref:Vps53 N-terminal domain-containing protein n=1 Tax=Soboliphyme baturini TaxID=241478 RepID=A0A3P8EMD2_9BILA|nr:unnamed protein product [Soboliphyme baturini]
MFLGNLDEVISNVDQQIENIDSEITAILETQSTAKQDSQTSLEEAKKAVQLLYARILEIKAKTEDSETMVVEITKDIKQLDQAKKNLTTSVTTLNHIHIMHLLLLYVLGGWIQTKNFADVAERLPGIQNVLSHFAKYMNLPEVRQLSGRVKNICTELSTLCCSEFKEYFTMRSKGHSSIQIAEVIKVISVLNPEVREELIKWLLDHNLAEYRVLYDDTQDSAWLDNVDQRYTWFCKRLIEFEQKFRNLIPPDWQIMERFTLDFCACSKDMLLTTMRKREKELNMKLLLFATQRTINFEALLWKRFPYFGLEEVTSIRKNPFHGSIGSCFERFMHVYMDEQDSNLNSLIDQLAAKFKERPPTKDDSASTASAAVPFPSSSELFLFYKKCIVQITPLGMSDNVLIDLASIFKKYLHEYATVSTAGLIQSILKEVSRLTTDEVFLTCSILVTAEFCTETTCQLQDKLREKLKDTEKCVHILVQDLEGACQSALQAMTKMQWASVDKVGDDSPYVRLMKQHLHTCVSQLRDFLTNSRKYFTQICLKFVNSLIPKFLSALFQCKPISVAGAQQLLLNTTSLKTELLNLPNVDSVVPRKPPDAYLKIVSTDTLGFLYDEFVEQYMEFLPQSDVMEFQKVLEMKSVRRTDQLPYVELYRKRLSTMPTSDEAPFQPKVSEDLYSAHPLLTLPKIYVDSHIKRLEKLMKTHL